ncbi:hypothetical protein FGG08_000489 [Glutinoglossum americanum]|uniref:ADP-ribosylhydrolase ARH3 n=1 Tax=Glutinoglossum americanum TaxID=1670608 RepID=A0A9P8L197_9PEZI|nr:hypothetical protein FGG08_000489 [Glutinoglossum americanum]
MLHQQSPPLGDRIRGSLFGLAIADALGAPVEFQKRGTFEPVVGYRHNETFDTPPGTWTDDTSMTLCLAQSLIDTSGTFTPQDAVRKYLRWYREGYLSSIDECFDIGMATRRAMEIWWRFFRVGGGFLGEGEMDVKGHEEGLEEIKKALGGKECCGNGSLMRASPIALLYFRSLPTACAHAATSSTLTHPHPANTEACIVYTLLLIRALHGAPKPEIASELGAWKFQDKDLKERFEGCKTVEDWGRRSEEGIRSSGWVVDTLEAACWAFFSTDGFEEGALRVVNLGDDADTVGAVYGALGGAHYGVDAIPKEWMEGLAKREVIEKIAEGVAELAERERDA